MNRYETQKYLGIDSSYWMIEEAKNSIQKHICSMWYVIYRILGKYVNVWCDCLFSIISSSWNQRKTPQSFTRYKKFITPNGSVYMTNWNLREQIKYQKSHRGNGDFDIKIGEFSRYYHGFTIEELYKLFIETWWNVVENRIFEWRRNIYSKIQPN